MGLNFIPPIQVGVTGSGRTHIFVVNSVVLTCIIENVVVMDTCLFSSIKCHLSIISTVSQIDTYIIKCN